MMPLLLATAISDSTPASGHALLPGGILNLLDAAVRALLVACVVGAGLRILAGRHVPAQKAAWGLVLAGALLMPLLAPWAGKANWLPSGATWVVPAHAWSQSLVSRVAGTWVAAPRVAGFNPAKTPLDAPRPAQFAAPSPATETSVASASERFDSSVPASSQADRFPAPTISSAQTAGADAESGRPAGTPMYLPLSDLVWMIYGTVCLALLLRLCYGLGGAIGLWQSAEPIQLDSNSALGLCLRCSRKISSPVTVGSAVVLPADYDEWDTEKLRIVLAHERSHVRQGDFYLQALAGLYTAIFWFNPLGWWLRRKLSDLSEAISDHAGLEEAASHASYARILLEFAALPRRTQVGVAMARTGRIAERIERLLNENSFRQAFTGGPRRLWAVLVLVPLAVFAATALVRVQAGVQAAQILQKQEQGPIVGQSTPPNTPEPAEASAPATPATNPAPPEDEDAAQAPATPAPPPASAPATPAAPALAPTPPTPPPGPDEADQTDLVQTNQDQTVTNTVTAQCNRRNTSIALTRNLIHVSSRNGYAYAYSSNGDSYALVSGSDKNHVSFSGDWYDGRRAEIDKARAMAHGDFLWFTRDGKSYIIDDPQIVARIQAMYKPMEDLGRQQEELGKQQAALGQQQAEMGHRQRLATIPTPDISHEMAELNAAIAALQAKKNGTITMEQLAELQGKIGELQGKLGGLQGQIGVKQGELGHQQGLLGEQQGRLGEQQGRLGAEQGRLAHEADSKVKSIIDESLKNGRRAASAVKAVRSS